MVRTAATIPPTLKSSWRDKAELGNAVERGEDESVALPRPALGVVGVDLMIKGVLLVVVVIVRRDLYWMKITAKDV
jgi:hypothetical protein